LPGILIAGSPRLRQRILGIVRFERIVQLIE
jgi:hypothetical protein